MTIRRINFFIEPTERDSEHNLYHNERTVESKVLEFLLNTLNGFLNVKRPCLRPNDWLVHRNHTNMSAKNLFLLDAAGALLSALMLGLVLPYYQEFFGIPLSALRLLAIPPVVFLVYDLVVWSRIKSNHGRWLRIIALANLAYCVFSLGIAYQHAEVMTLWGKGYLVGEILVVVLLAIWELRAARLMTYR